MTVRLAILGSTGSIGRQTLDVVDHLSERFEVVALAAGRNFDLLREQVARYRPRVVSVQSDAQAGAIDGCDVVIGPEGLVTIATLTDVDIVVIATSGHAAITPTLRAIEAGKTVALANKETIVCAGEVILRAARQKGVAIRPVDSEHSALWQCLSIPHHPADIASVTLTASGGALLRTPLDELASVTVDQALAHPNWSMGSKVTIDSATMMNKGLEIIEAHWLFDLPYDSIDVVIHPQSIVHSMASFVDGSVVAQLAIHDMRLPIQFALTYPERAAASHLRLDIDKLGSLQFEPVDQHRFPALRLARDAGRAGRTFPTVLSAADEIAVDAFLAGLIPFSAIVEVVERILQRHVPASDPITLESVAEADRWARQETMGILQARFGAMRSESGLSRQGDGENSSSAG